MVGGDSFRRFSRREGHGEALVGRNRARRLCGFAYAIRKPIQRVPMSSLSHRGEGGRLEIKGTRKEGE